MVERMQSLAIFYLTLEGFLRDWLTFLAEDVVVFVFASVSVHHEIVLSL
jgi:hypothetical protein